MPLRPLIAAPALALLLAATPAARGATPSTGGTAYAPTPSTATTTNATTTRRAARTAQATITPTPPATLGPDGLAVAPQGAPPAVVALVAAGNAIATTPYRYGGGHGDFMDTAYDCSGSVSFALHGAGLLDTTLDSTALARWGAAGPGRWITVYANKTHTFLTVAGLRFDTSGRPKGGSRWQTAPRSVAGFRVRHPPGL